jgi:hypothetical protein
MSGEGSTTPAGLRRLGDSLQGIGWSWIITLLGSGTGLTLEGHQFLPLLWIGPPWLVMRIRESAGLAPPAVARQWTSAATLGLVCWLVAVPASLVGLDAVKQIAYVIGTTGGAVLFCGGFMALTRSIGWTEHERHWQRALYTLVGADVLAIVVVGGLSLSRGSTSGVAEPVAVLMMLVVVVVGVVSLLRLRRVLCATRAGLRTVPEVAGVGTVTNTPRPPTT